MLALQQLRAVGAVRPAGAARAALPACSRVPRALPVPSTRRGVVSRASSNDSGLDPEMQAKLDELQAKVNKWWGTVDDKPTFFLYVGVSVLGVTIANQFLRAVDVLPVLPNLLKLVGLVYSSWFTYKYLLFAEGRTQLGKDFDKLKEGIAGSVKGSSGGKVDRDLAGAVSSLKSKVADASSDLNKSLRN